MKLGMGLIGRAATLNMLNNARERFTTDASFIVGTDVQYAIHVEFGTSNQRAQPYMRPAVESVMSRSDSIWRSSGDVQEFIRDLAFEIESEAKRLCPVDTGNLRTSIEARKV